MLEATIDDIIDEHWAYPEEGIRIIKDLRQAYHSLERDAQDAVFTEGSFICKSQMYRPHSSEDRIAATLEYDDHPVIETNDETKARIEYHAHPEYQNGLLRPVQTTIDANTRMPLLTEAQIKNAIAGLQPQDTQDLFDDGLTTVHLYGKRADGSRASQTFAATYQGLRDQPDKDNYDTNAQAMTRPQGEHAPHHR